MEIVNICLDIIYIEDRHNIIQKYLLPRLLSHELKLSDINSELYSDIFNILETSDVEALKDEIVKIVGDFEPEEFVEINWKIGHCSNCNSLGNLTKCKKEHEEECPYGETTDPEGCGNKFCDNCIYLVCSNFHPDCPAFRCESCTE